MHSVIPPYSLEALSIASGSLWRHYKSPEVENYVVSCVARVESTQEEVVVYRACFGDENIWTRPVTDFLSSATNERGEVVARFLPVTAEY